MKTISYVIIAIVVIFAMYLLMHAPIYNDVKCMSGFQHSHFGYCQSGRFFDITNAYGLESKGFDNYPSIESKEFCDWYFAKTPNVPVNHIMQNEIQKNPLTMYFLSKFPDASYRTTMTEESEPTTKKIYLSLFFKQRDFFNRIFFCAMSLCTGTFKLSLSDKSN